MPTRQPHLTNPLFKKAWSCTIIPSLFLIFQSPLRGRQLKFNHLPFFSKKGASELWSAIYLFYVSLKCISKINLSNVLKVAILSGTVDGMWCFIYYHLDVNKGCWGETCNHNFQPLKLIKQDFSNFFVVTFPSDISDMFYRGCYWFYQNLTKKTKSYILLLARLSCF